MEAHVLLLYIINFDIKNAYCAISQLNAIYIDIKACMYIIIIICMHLIALYTEYEAIVRMQHIKFVNDHEF